MEFLYLKIFGIIFISFFIGSYLKTYLFYDVNDLDFEFFLFTGLTGFSVAAITMFFVEGYIKFFQ
ncbi:MAG: hypothetical protein KAS02_02640 [Candidatus Pacebacteria bacterium]|nr:hypothetical protein [Candidatus Paceibacterota bacterium]